MEEDKNWKNEEILQIRFIGEKLKKEGDAVPIYELGQILISFQQIIYKTFIYKNKAHLGHNEREKLALKMTSRRKGSDVYGFAAFLEDPVVHAFLAPLIVKAVSAIGEYVYGRVKKLLEKRKSPDKSIAAIFPQLHNILKRIESIGGVGSIQISVPNGPSVILNIGTKNDVIESVKDKVFYDTEREIRGIVTSFHTRRYMVIVDAEQIGNVKVHLGDKLFRQIRYKVKRDAVITFKGKPKYQFGKESYLKFEEFDADSVVIKESDFV
ncbi:MAG: hypothetical protein JSV88_04740 [Candidatus Aminicenantes bacterium]|nr:MAG: hypothetical protein JSV88_04740 [Candidatus Aminicenantes bacterium]